MPRCSLRCGREDLGESGDETQISETRQMEALGLGSLVC